MYNLTFSELVLWGIIIHLVCDWLLQNEWMAKGKVKFGSKPSLVHGIIHSAFSTMIFTFPANTIIMIAHMFIDTRIPLQWWRRVFRQTTEGDMAIHVAIWEDQVLHIVVIVIAAWLQHRNILELLYISNWLIK